MLLRLWVRPAPWCMLLWLGTAVAGCRQGSEPATGDVAVNVSATGVIPGEFEPQDAMLLTWLGPEKLDPSPDAVKIREAQLQSLSAIVEATSRALQPLVLVPDAATREHARDAMADMNAAPFPPQLLVAPLDSFWVRDFGPISVCGGDRAWLVDARYVHQTDRGGGRRDDQIPEAIARHFRMELHRSEMDLSSGNLLSNGQGLLIATTRLLDGNRLRGYGREEVEQELSRLFGVQELVLLEPLVEEPTGHVDIFATFTSPDTLVVGENEAQRADPQYYLPSYLDLYHQPHPPEETRAMRRARRATWLRNQAILNENVSRLRQVRMDGRPLNIHRIPMPPPGWFCWGGSYTNVIYANGVLIVPSYPDVDAEAEQAALDVYRALLPDWEIVSIDARPFVLYRGAFHCLSMNIWKTPAAAGGADQ